MSLKVNEELTLAASTFNGSMRIGSYKKSGVVLVLCHTSLTFE